MAWHLARRIARIAPATPVPGEVATVSIPGGDRVVMAGTTATLIATVETIGGADDAVTWSSSDHDVATIDAEGRVTAHGSGTADITATSTADPTRSATITLTVREPSAVTHVTIDQGDLDLRVDASLMLTATVTTTGDADDAVSWASSDPDVATIDDDGEAFIRSYDMDGEHRWTRQFGALRGDRAHGVATDPSGHVYVVGSTGDDEFVAGETTGSSLPMRGQARPPLRRSASGQGLIAERPSRGRRRGPAYRRRSWSRAARVRCSRG